MRYFFYSFSMNTYFDYFIVLIVVLNALFMALDGDLFPVSVRIEFALLNYFFNAIFIFEFIVKMLGYGPISIFFLNKNQSKYPLDV